MIDLINNGDSKQGAIDALSLLIAAKEREIHIKQDKDKQKAQEQQKLKMPKNVKLVDVDELEQEENEKENIKSETEEERKERIERIKADAEDSEKIQKDLDQISADLENKNAELARLKAAKQKEIDDLLAKTGSNGKYLDIHDFKKDLRLAIKHQVRPSRRQEDDFRKYNATYSNSDLIMPGLTYPETKDIPNINIYFDMSGSLDQTAIDQGLEAVRGLNDLKKRGLIKYKVYWFANDVFNTQEEAREQGGTRAFPDILEHIKRTHSNNVIIFTDSDFDRQTDFRKISPLTVSGCVWWVWASGDKARTAFKYLQSRRKGGTFQYQC